MNGGSGWMLGSMQANNSDLFPGIDEVSHAATMLVAKGDFHVRKSPPGLCRGPEQQ